MDPELPRPPRPHPDRLLLAALSGAVALGLIPALLGGCVGGLMGGEQGHAYVFGGTMSLEGMSMAAVGCGCPFALLVGLIALLVAWSRCR